VVHALAVALEAQQAVAGQPEALAA